MLKQNLDPNNNQNPKSNENGKGPKFTISFENKWTRWLVITLIFLVVLLLLQLTGMQNVLLNILFAFMPLGLALVVVLILNPLIYRLIKLKFNRIIAKYLTFFLSLIFGICVIILVLWLFISQFASFITQLLGDNNTIKQLLDKWMPEDQPSVLKHIFGFNYNSEKQQWLIQTNLDWDSTVATNLRNQWEKYLSTLLDELKKAADTKNTDSIFPALIAELRNDFGIYIDPNDKVVIDYLRFLGQPSLTNVAKYFTDLYEKMNDFIKTSKTASLPSLPESLLSNIEVAKIGQAIDGNKLGKIYQLLFSFGVTAQWFFSSTFLLDIINKVYHYTTASNLTTIFLNNYFWTIASFFYGLFITIMITMFLLGGDQTFTNFLKTQLIPGKDPKRKEVIILALQKSLFGYGRGILIDMSYMFIFTTLMVIIAGYGFGGATYKSSFVVLGLFMSFANIVPYIGPLVGIIPIILAGILDALVANSGTNELISWAPMLMGVLGAFLVQLVENLFVYPKVFGRVTKLHPVTILMGVSIFGVIGGIFGMVVAVPTIATIKAIANDIYNKKIIL